MTKDVVPATAEGTPKFHRSNNFTSGAPLARKPLKFLRPAGCPVGLAPHVWRQTLEARAQHHADALARLVAALDAMDSDADFEPTLGACEVKVGGYDGWQYPAAADQRHWGEGLLLDGEQEVEDEHGGDIQDEPHDFLDEGNGDYCIADEMHGDGMSAEAREQVQEECDRLLAQARELVPPPPPNVISFFERKYR